MTIIRIVTETSTTPATTGFASAYGAILMGATNLRTHQGYAYYDSHEIELLACLKTLELGETAGFFQYSQQAIFISDHNTLSLQIQQIQAGFIHSNIQQAIWDRLQDFRDLSIDFSDLHPDITPEVEAITSNELCEGLIGAMDHLIQTNRKISVFCSQESNINTLLFGQRIIEYVQKDNLTLYLHETAGPLFDSLLTQAIQHKIDYHIVGAQPNCHAATYIYADHPTRWLAQQTCRAYGITPASAIDKTHIAEAMNVFEQRHKHGRLLSFEP